MSNNEQTLLSQPTSAVRNTLGKEQAPQNLVRSVFDEALREYYDKNYHQILPIIAKKVHQEKVQQEKLKAVKARLNYKEDQRLPSQTTNKGKKSVLRIPGDQCGSQSYIPHWAHKLLPKSEDKLECRDESIDGYDDLKKAFLKNYLQQKKCMKDPVKIHNIKQRDGESTEEFVRRYKLECRDVKGAPECMKISGFMHGITNPELIKRLHDNIPKSMDEMMRVTTTFHRGQVAASNYERKKPFPSWKQQEIRQKQNFKMGSFRSQQRTQRKQDRFTLLTKTPKEILAMDKGKFKPPPPMTTLRVARQRITQTFSPESVISFPSLGEEDGTEGPMIIEAEMGGHYIHRMYVDGGSSSEILYEHCFNRFRPEVKNLMVPAAIPLVGFIGEIIWPLGQISLLVKIGDEEHSTSAWMNFMVVRSPSPYNGIIGRQGVRKIRAIPSTAHGMLKFPVAGRIVTLRSSRIIPLECLMVSEPGVSRPIINQVSEEKNQVAIHPEYPEQTIAIGSTLSEEGRKELCGLLRRHLDVFSWKPSYMTGVPRHVAEHRLNIREGCLPVRQKKRGQAPERNKAICEEVEKLMDAGIMKEVHYHSWLSNPMMVKKHDDSWRMCVDFKDLNKACPKDGYPLLEID
ncbi:reverse transcriptase domain-containing protein [Tanacetum coccineum]|uniref:Reverse transcriptase domain-containing protein n=1 Tax=Tanacetum coccineum TaxID=301880 RepID=A0ABQ5HAD8_9ASTR